MCLENISADFPGNSMKKKKKTGLNGCVYDFLLILLLLTYILMNTVKNYITIHFAVKLDRCDGSCNTLNDLSNKIYVPNKTEGLNLSVFNLIMGINWSITLTKHVSPRCKYKFDGRKCNSN